MNNNKYTITKIIWCLAEIQGCGTQRLKEIFESIKTLGENEILEFIKTQPESRQFEAIFSGSFFDRIWDECKEREISLLSWFDPEYPKNLFSVYDPPPILHVKGTLIPEDEMAIAIVGSRNPTFYGIRTASKFAYELAERGITIISGFARGIDGEAHRACLKAKGRTVAVLGSGLDVIYPKEHERLFGEVSQSGAVISEFPLKTSPQAFNFPRRNRIISGLSRGVLVIEANQKSGSLITASVAAEEGREVYAIPGPIDSMTSMGTNQLIQNGAKLVVSSMEILEDLVPQIKASIRHCEARPIGAEAISKSWIASTTSGTLSRNDNDPILKLLAKSPLSFDELIFQSDLDSNQLRSRLMELELEGAVKRLFGGQYVRR